AGSALLAGSATCRLPERATPPARPGGGGALQAALPCPAPGLLSSLLRDLSVARDPCFKCRANSAAPRTSLSNPLILRVFSSFCQAARRPSPRCEIAPERHAPGFARIIPVQDHY